MLLLLNTLITYLPDHHTKIVLNYSSINLTKQILDLL